MAQRDPLPMGIRHPAPLEQASAVMALLPWPAWRSRGCGLVKAPNERPARMIVYPVLRRNLVPVRGFSAPVRELSGNFGAPNPAETARKSPLLPAPARAELRVDRTGTD
jgi:hypothetical protein